MTNPTRIIILNPFHPLTSLGLDSAWLIVKRGFWLLAISLLLALVMSVFFQINRLAQETSLLQKGEQRLVTLSQDNQVLKVRVSQSKGYQVLAPDLMRELNLVEAGFVHYIKAGVKPVASRSFTPGP